MHIFIIYSHLYINSFPCNDILPCKAFSTYLKCVFLASICFSKLNSHVQLSKSCYMPRIKIPNLVSYRNPIYNTFEMNTISLCFNLLHILSSLSELMMLLLIHPDASATQLSFLIFFFLWLLLLIVLFNTYSKSTAGQQRLKSDYS